MFVPPEQRPPGPARWNPPPPKRHLSKRSETIVLWMVGFILVSIFLAPLGGSTVAEAVWFFLTR